MAGLVGLLVALYGWSVTSLRPRGMPVLAAGPPGPAAALADRLTNTEPGTLRVAVVPDGVAADAALRDRKAYAAFVLGPSGLSLHVASAASPAVAEALRQGLRRMMPDLDVPVVDVAPNAPADRIGGGLAAGYLPLVLVVAAAGVLLVRAVRGRRARPPAPVLPVLAALAALAVLAGVAGAVALQDGLAVLPGSHLTVVAGIGLLTLAVAGPIVGLGVRAGGLGLTAGMLLFVFAAPLSAASSAPEMLPRPWGAVGQLLPPGAGVTLLRSTAYFDGAGGGRAAAVLVVWAAVGVALTLLGGVREAEPRPRDRAGVPPARPAAGAAVGYPAARDAPGRRR
jgi:hypothetical protein